MNNNFHHFHHNKLIFIVILVFGTAAVVVNGQDGKNFCSAKQQVLHFIGKSTTDVVTYKDTLFKTLGGGSRVEWNTYDGTGYSGLNLPGYNNPPWENHLFSRKKVVFTEDMRGKLGIGSLDRTDEEMAAYLAMKGTNRKQKLLRRKLQASTESEINGNEVVRVTFGGIRFDQMWVHVANLLPGESAMYRTYQDGVRVSMGIVEGERSDGFVEFPITSAKGFDTIEFLVDPNKPQSRFLISHLEYCRPSECSGKYAEIWGDVHAISFDKLNWDCQGEGHFIIFEGQRGVGQKPFQIQGVFNKKDTVKKQLTVTRKVAIDSGDSSTPIVQITAPEDNVNGCKDYKFYVGGVETDINSGTKNNDVHLTVVGNTGAAAKLELTYPTTNTKVTIHIWSNSYHGCMIDTKICLGTYWDTPDIPPSDVRGILGNKPNGIKSDDWVDRQGTALTASMNDLRGITAFDFCVNTWCIKNETESLFTYESGETFYSLDKCGEAYKGGIENEIEVSKLNAYHPCYTAAKGNVDDIETCFTECVAAEMLGGSVSTCIKNFEDSRESSRKTCEGSGSYTPNIKENVLYEPGSGKTRMPTNTPTALPTTSPPTKKPTAAPTTSQPTKNPTAAPTTSPPTQKPTAAPTTPSPTQNPTAAPTTSPPTQNPTAAPTTSPPTQKPTAAPTTSPPTQKPTEAPTTSPPTTKPTAAPTTTKPTAAPTTAPTTDLPSSVQITSKPSSSPSDLVFSSFFPTSSGQTTAPTTSPPTTKPTAAPTASPTTSKPTAAPTASPTTSKPSSVQITSKPSSSPSDLVFSSFFPTSSDQITSLPPTPPPTVLVTPPPTPPPTVASTPSPTQTPTAAPVTPPPTPPPTASVVETTEKIIYSASGAKGDPHFKLWNGESYDFHGICDLVLLHNPEFNNGLGMDIHIRTKQMKYWSYIKTAVIRIGNESFEVMAEKKHNYYWNNQIAGDEEIYTMKELPSKISGYNIQFSKKNSQQLIYTIVIGNNNNNNGNKRNKNKRNKNKRKNKDEEEKIVIKTWNNFVRVDVINPTYENFKHSVGLMGTFEESAKMGRDNTTIINDLNIFGQEWQVLPSEPKLFHNLDGPQAPARCEIPSTMELRRRLAETNVDRKSAELACSHISQQDEFNLCVFDVIATSDEKVAGAY